MTGAAEPCRAKQVVHLSDEQHSIHTRRFVRRDARPWNRRCSTVPSKKSGGRGRTTDTADTIADQALASSYTKTSAPLKFGTVRIRTQNSLSPPVGHVPLPNDR